MRHFLAKHPHLIFGAAVALAVIILGVVGTNLFQERDDVLEHATENAENIALVVERDATRNLQLLDLSLQAVIDGVKDPGVMRLPAQYRQQILFDRSASAGRYLGALLYVDAHGDIVFDSKSEFPRSGNFADRPWFTEPREHPNVGLYISPPYRSRLRDQQASIAVSRRVSHPDGSFAGVVVAAIELDYFHHLLSGLQLGAQGSIALMQLNGTVVMRLPDSQKWVGKSLKGTENYERYRRLHERSFFGRAALDGAERIYVYRQFKEVPFLISVGLGVGDIYLKWKERAQRVAFLTVLLAMSLLMAAWMLTQEFKYRLAVEKNLSLLARMDGLTGLNNRRTLDESYERELLRAQRTKSPLSLLFVDIDHFKTYNDTYGHQAGDKALAAVAMAIAASIKRPQDIAARFGGEEFVVMLPDTKLSGAEEVADRIQNAVHVLGMEHRDSEFGVVTVSIGYACSTSFDRTEQKGLIEASDHALYQAKVNGRNQSRAYRTPEVSTEVSEKA
ncbi:diguanylate cyclase [Neisseriaceae bacterium JH1-16]|nr:diguanylate cyclase [Neisseriaceae bacterium JH1-16]